MPVSDTYFTVCVRNPGADNWDWVIYDRKPIMVLLSDH